MSDERLREHLAYAPDHGLFALYRGAGGVVLAGVMAVLGMAGAFLELPSFELRPVMCVTVGVLWGLWWVVVWVVYAKGAGRLTTDVLAMVDLGAAPAARTLARVGVAATGLALLLLVFVLSPVLIDDVGRDVAGMLIADGSSGLAVVALVIPVWTAGPALATLRMRGGLTSGKGLLLLAVLVSLVGVALTQIRVMEGMTGGVFAFVCVGIAVSIVALLSAGLRKRVAAILGAIARLEGEEEGRGEIARVFSSPDDNSIEEKKNVKKSD